MKKSIKLEFIIPFDFKMTEHEVEIILDKVEKLLCSVVTRIINYEVRQFYMIRKKYK